MSDTFAELRAAGVCVLRACGLVGRARASHYRHVRSPMHGPRSARVVPDNGQALSAAQRAAVLGLINSLGYADLSIGQIWARELDEGCHWCSASSMYWIARGGRTVQATATASHPSGEGETRTDCRRPVAGMDLGYNEAARPDPRGSGSSSTC
jgi:putative transposase